MPTSTQDIQAHMAVSLAPWRERWGTADEVAFLLNLEERGLIGHIRKYADLVLQRRWDAGVDARAVHAKCLEILARHGGARL